MTPDEWSKVKALFEAALASEPSQRAALLAQNCPDDRLRREVEKLLINHEEAGSFLSNPVLNPSTVTIGEGDEPMTGRQLGVYQLVRRVGQGGMAAVFLAERNDGEFRQQVAIKLVSPGSDTDEVLSRFRTERQTLAGLDHPNIVKLLDGGSTPEGLPYLVMDYVEGSAIDRYCDNHKLSVEERLRLFARVCEAVEYAHEKRIVHRDLKPGNILVTAEGVPKLLDFGIAKLLEPSALVLTHTGSRCMTPAYASPEQVRGKPVTTATDIYSLGAVLYELLTGQRPYRLKENTAGEIERAICEQEPEKPNAAAPEKLRRPLRGDLDNIVLKALAKEPERRYSSVEEFAQDIDRHLRHLPVKARRSTMAYRASRLVKRHKIEVSVTLAALFALAPGSWFAFKTPGLRDLKQTQLTTNSAEMHVTAAAISPSGKYLAYAEPGGIQLRPMQTRESHSLPISAGFYIRTIEWFPDETRLLLASAEGTRFPGLWIISVFGGPPHLLDDQAHEGAISPDGTSIVCTRASYKEIWLMNAHGGNAHRIMTAPADDLIGRRPVFFPNGKRILFGRLHPTNGEAVGTIESSDLEGKQVRPFFPVQDVGFISNCFLVLADGRLIYPQPERKSVRLMFGHAGGHNLWEARIDLQTGELKSRPRQITSSVGSGIGELSATSDGKRLGVLRGPNSSTVYVGDLLQNGTSFENPRRFTFSEASNSLSGWTPDGKALVLSSDRENPSGNDDLFRQALGQSKAEPVVVGPGNKTFGAVSPDGAWVYYLVVSEAHHPGDAVNLMRAPLTGGEPRLVVGGHPVVAVSCSHPSANRCIVTEYAREQFIFYHLDASYGEGRELLRLSNPGQADSLTRFFEPLAFATTCRITPDGAFIVCARVNKDPVTFRFLPLGEGQERDLTVRGAISLSHYFDLAPDGKGIYTQGVTAEGKQDIYIGPDGAVHPLRLASWENSRVSPDGRHLAFEKPDEFNNVWLIENF